MISELHKGNYTVSDHEGNKCFYWQKLIIDHLDSNNRV